MQVDQEHAVLDAWNQLENAQAAENRKKNESVEQLKVIHESRAQLEHNVATTTRGCRQFYGAACGKRIIGSC